MRAVIVTGGSICDYTFYNGFFRPDDFVICADGGIAHLIELGVQPDLFLGDFDSCDFSSVKDLPILEHAQIVRHAVRKNETDTQLAVGEALARGMKEIVILGGIGSRADHTLANVFLLKMILENGAEGVLLNENNEVRLLDRSTVLHPRAGRHISLLPLTAEVSGITLRGLSYPLDNFTMKMGDSIGISNEFTKDDAVIQFKSGLLLVILSKD